MLETEMHRLVERFEAATLTQEEWTHEAHVRVGLMLIERHGLEAGSERFRSGLQRLNRAHGVGTTKDRGYHETITLTYLALICDFRQRLAEGVGLEEIADRLVLELRDRNLLLNYFTPKRLNSFDARISWIEPDLKRLPIPDFPGPSYKSAIDNDMVDPT